LLRQTYFTINVLLLSKLIDCGGRGVKRLMEVRKLLKTVSIQNDNMLF
jgi:hypothetical protein